MATTRDAQPITPITDSAKFDLLDRLVYEVAREDTPLLYMAQHIPTSNSLFKVTEKKRRAVGTTLASAMTSAGILSMELSLSNFVAKGDVVEIGDESLFVVSVSSTTVAVVARGKGGTTAATHASGVSVFLAGHAHFYGESFSTDFTQKKSLVSNYLQDFLSVTDITYGEIEEAQPLVPGASDAEDEGKMEKMADCKQNIEMAMFRNYAYQAPTSAKTAAMSYGLRGRLTSALGATITTLDTDGELSREIFNEVMREIQVAGKPAGPIYVFCDKIAYQAPADWIKDMQRVPELNPGGTVGVKSNQYQPPMGPPVTLIHEPVLDRYSTGSMYILDMSKVKIRVGGKGREWLKYHEVGQERKTRKAGFYRARAALQLLNPECHGVITNIKEVV